MIKSERRDFSEWNNKKAAERQASIEEAQSRHPWNETRKQIRGVLEGKRKLDSEKKALEQETLQTFEEAKAGNIDAPFLQEVSLFIDGDKQPVSKEIQVNFKANTTHVVTHADEQGNVRVKKVDVVPDSKPGKKQEDFFQKYVNPGNQEVAFYQATEADESFKDWHQFIEQFSSTENAHIEVREAAAMFRAFILKNKQIQDKLSTVDFGKVEERINDSIVPNSKVTEEVSLGDAWTKMNIDSEAGLVPQFSGPEGLSLVINNDRIFLSIEKSAGSSGESTLIPPGGGIDNDDKTLKKVHAAVSAVAREMGEEHGIKEEDMTVTHLGETVLENDVGKNEIDNYYASYSLVVIRDDNEIDEKLIEDGDEQIPVGAVELSIWELVQLIDKGYITKEGNHQVDDRIVAGLLFTLAKADLVTNQLQETGNKEMLRELNELSSLLNQSENPNSSNELNDPTILATN